MERDRRSSIVVVCVYSLGQTWVEDDRLELLLSPPGSVQIS